MRTYRTWMLVLCRQEKTAILIMILVTAVCLAGTCLLDGIGRDQFSKDYSPEMTDGTLVRWSGTAGEVTDLTGGSVLLDVSGVRVFIPSSAGNMPAIQAGSSVVVIGTVQHWKGTEEILVEDERDIKIT